MRDPLENGHSCSDLEPPERGALVAAQPRKVPLAERVGIEPASAQAAAAGPSFRTSFFVGIWPMICLVALVVMWIATFARIEHSRAETIDRATRQAQAEASAYRGFVERSLTNSDQLLEVIRFRWSHGGVDLEALKKQGAFPGQDWLGAGILNQDAFCVTATFGCVAGQSYAYREYFRFHRDNAEDVAHLGQALMGTNGGTTHPLVVHLSRRLVDAKGQFAGVAMLSLQEPYFTEFFSGSSLSEPDFIALVGTDGDTRALRIGPNNINTAEPRLPGPARIQGNGGSTRLAQDEWSPAPEPSLIAWRRLDRFPMYAVVGLSEERVLASWVEARRNALRFALLWSVAFIGIGWASGVLALRFVSKHVREERIRAAYRVATDGTRDGLSFLEPLVDATGRIVDLIFIDCNEAAASMLGMTRHQLVGQQCADLIGEPALQQSMQLFERAALLGHVETVLEGCAVGPLVGSILWVEHRIVRTGLGFAVTLRDVTEVVVHREELEQMANEDRLTGLPNRNWLENEVARLIQSRVSGESRFALLFVDFDGFKRVNDSMGHSAGDELLRAAAQRLRSQLGSQDCVVRLGGDEFVILARSVVSELPLAALAGQIVSAFAAPFRLPQGEIKMGVSIGICMHPEHGDSMEELLRNADIAMYEEKASRRGRFSFFRPELFSAVKRKFEMEGAILNAIDRNEFVLHFQPQFAIDTGSLVGFEALIRWVRPGRGLVLPGDFVPVAEEAGLITRLGEQVIEKACQQLATWRALELPVVPVSVNVSAIQFHQSDIRLTFEQALTRYRIPPEMIQMEITESSMIGNEVSISAMLQQIRGLGVKISVDDFGTGYSSLSQLQQLRVDAIKIDRSFISKMQDSSEGEVFVRAIISMAHALAMKVVAEGVETPVQLDSLRRLQCEAAQGYLFSKPLAATLATDLLVEVARRQPMDRRELAAIIRELAMPAAS